MSTPLPEIDRVCDPEHQDFVATLNSMARAAVEKDEKAYDAFYFQALGMLDDLHDELSKHAGFDA